jgi:hypothetical protein
MSKNRKFQKTRHQLAIVILNATDAQKPALQYRVFRVNILRKHFAIEPDLNVCPNVKKVSMLMETNARDVLRIVLAVHRPKNV